MRSLRRVIPAADGPETPGEKARRIGVPLVPARPRRPESGREGPDGVLAVCGECGTELRRVMMLCCQSETCPCGLGRPARMVGMSFDPESVDSIRWTDTGGTWGNGR